MSYGASLSRGRAPGLWIARAGWRHRRHGDRWSFTVNVYPSPKWRAAFLEGGVGRGSKRSNQRCMLAVIRLLQARGVRRMRWERADGDGGFRRVRRAGLN